MAHRALMDGLDVRLLTYVIWGIGTTLVYGYVLLRRGRAYRRRHDRRARRELLTAIGLFLTAFAANFAILVVLFVPQGQDVRGFFVAFALGAFSAVGVNLATDSGEVV